MSERGRGRPQLPEIDVREHGARRGDVEQAMDRRLFMQLLVFTSPPGEDPDSYVDALRQAFDADRRLHGVMYADVNDPRGLGLLTWSEDPNYFVDAIRPLFRRERLRDLALRPEYTMMGRSYGSGHEQNLEHWILERPVQNVTHEGWDWAVWYPLRRSGAFEKLDDDAKRAILMEHALIGRAYGAKELAHDVRLACHGIDARDNEFLIGLIGKTLHPLSHVVQSMRKTKQTSEYIVQMGPFFVGKRLWVSKD